MSHHAVTLDDLAGPHLADVVRDLRSTNPVVWLDCIDGWFVTGRAEAVEAMRDADRFTVDDPRFTTARLVGPSMLSTDGAEHRRHRSPFVGLFRRSVVRSNLQEAIFAEAVRLVADFEPDAHVDLRAGLAGPLAVTSIAGVLGLDVATEQVIAWYRAIVDGVTDLSAGADKPTSLSTKAVEALGPR